MSLGSLLLTITPLLQTEASEALADQLYSEGTAGWHALEAAMSGVEASGLESILVRDGQIERQRRETQLEFRLNGKSRLLRRHPRTGPATGAERILGTNPQYAFIVERRSPSAPLILRYFSPNKELVAEMMDMSIVRYLPAPWMIAAKSLGDLIREPTFRLRRILPDERGLGHLARLEFDYEPANPKETAIRGGWILVAPTKFWAVQGYECETPWGNLIGSVKYTERTNSTAIPVLAQVKIVFRYDRTEGETEYNFNFSSYELKDTPDSEFTLSAFGLPELDPSSTTTSKSGLTTPALFAVACLCGVIAAALGFYGRRLQRSETLLSPHARTGVQITPPE